MCVSYVQCTTTQSSYNAYIHTDLHFVTGKRRGTKREGKATKELCASCCWCNCAVAKKGILHWIKPDCTRGSEATHL